MKSSEEGADVEAGLFGDFQPAVCCQNDGWLIFIFIGNSRVGKFGQFQCPDFFSRFLCKEFVFLFVIGIGIRGG